MGINTNYLSERKNRKIEIGLPKSESEEEGGYVSKGPVGTSSDITSKIGFFANL